MRCLPYPGTGALRTRKPSARSSAPPRPAPGEPSHATAPRATRACKVRQPRSQILMNTPSGLYENLFVFVLASFLGLELIRGVSRLLHTPLMSLTNAIASIALVAPVITTGRHAHTLSTPLG